MKLINKNKRFTLTPMNIGVGTAKEERGFTLVELMVVFSISALIASVMIASYPDFSSQIKFKNTVLDVALAIREAQVYGAGAKEVKLGSPADPFNVAYGVHFDMNKPNSFILFADANGDDEYTSTGEDVESFTIERDFKIKDICINNGTICYLPSGVQKLLDVMFKRPNPDAIINMGPNAKVANGTIQIINTKNGKVKTVRVTSTGQISVE